MRIISGFARGRRLQAPSSQRIRPTTDRVRESLFSILGDLQDTVILDAFAGSGALGCEALSRGASFCFFCDPSREAQRIISHNASSVLQLDASSYTLFPLSLQQALPRLHLEPDVVFLDPPYHLHDLLSSSLDWLASSPHIIQDTLLVIEQEQDAPPPDHPDFLLDEARAYGRTRVTFLYRA